MRLPLLLFFVFSSLYGRAQELSNLDRKLDVFWNSKKLRAKLLSEVASFRAGDTIADVGAADGWFSAAISVYADSLVFYLEDIDSVAWNSANFDRAVTRFFSKVQKTPTHQYRYWVGNPQDTGLPRRSFDYVLIIDTFHHFTFRQEMMSHIVNLLKPEGKIILLEAIARRPGDTHPGCRSKIFSRETIVADLAGHGMRLEKSRYAGKTSGRRNEILVFAATD